MKANIPGNRAANRPGSAKGIVSDATGMDNAPIFVIVPLQLESGIIVRREILEKTLSFAKNIDGNRLKSIQVGTTGEFDRAITGALEYEGVEVRVGDAPDTNSSEVLLEFVSAVTNAQLEELAKGFKNSFGLSHEPKLFNFALSTYPVRDYRNFTRSIGLELQTLRDLGNPTL